MKSLSPRKIATLRSFRRIRGGQSDTDKTEKQWWRLEAEGLLLKMRMPSGSPFYYLSSKGVEIVNAPKSYAEAPSDGVIYASIAASQCSRDADDFIFLSHQETDELLAEPTRDEGNLHSGRRFLLHKVKTAGGTPEMHLHYFFAEFRPPADIVRRVKTIIEVLRSKSAVVRELTELNLFGVTIAVPTEAVERSLKTANFPVEVIVKVVPALSSLALKRRGEIKWT